MELELMVIIIVNLPEFSSNSNNSKASNLIKNDIRINYPEVDEALNNLYIKGVIYIGRNGYGGTYNFRKEQRKSGGKFLNNEGLAEIEKEILLNLADEGPEWASYNSLIDWLKNKGTIQ